MDELRQAVWNLRVAFKRHVDHVQLEIKVSHDLYAYMVGNAKPAEYGFVNEDGKSCLQIAGVKIVPGY